MSDQSLEKPLVLVMGFRTGIAKALEGLGIPYLVWSPKPIHRKGRQLQMVIQPFPHSEEEMLKTLPDANLLTHVIAGTEESVVPAARIRRWSGARINSETMLIRTTDKLEMKSYLSKSDIPMTEFLPSTTDVPPEGIFQKLGNPVVCKPRNSSGSRGFHKISQVEGLKPYLKEDVILEKLIEGREGSVESLIVSGEVVFHNLTEYAEIGKVNVLPYEPLNEELSNVLSLNSKVVRALKLKWGMTHMEYYKTADGILFGEIAARPPGGYLLDTMSLAYGRNLWEDFVRVELKIPLEGNFRRVNYAASVILHPGEGVVREVLGVEEVKSLPSLKRLRIKVKSGDQIEKREGLGNDCGYVLLANPSQAELLKDLKTLKSQLKISLSHDIGKE